MTLYSLCVQIFYVTTVIECLSFLFGSSENLLINYRRLVTPFDLIRIHRGTSIFIINDHHHLDGHHFEVHP
ncbi:hypothetical protein DERP_004075 [Dermatophagoides pteronyssinus]|uniref:Secreted protein n=1 Tax=Dermatophagoides pteronyssinus TaxID=6956 RepID=A0ABQ8J855_DERPT|nr:hypothetical protein DERP_004075 [Dermatophagoides pteronyssinus]